jgi:hypothetical protein
MTERFHINVIQDGEVKILSISKFAYQELQRFAEQERLAAEIERQRLETEEMIFDQKEDARRFRRNKIHYQTIARFKL